MGDTPVHRGTDLLAAAYGLGQRSPQHRHVYELDPRHSRPQHRARPRERAERGAVSAAR